MGLSLSATDITTLESSTEGWIAGLQLAAISLQGHQDIDGFIRSFTGNHRFVVDDLIEEVLNRQPKSIQAFLLRTSILDHMCSQLCDAVLAGKSDNSGDHRIFKHVNPSTAIAMMILVAIATGIMCLNNVFQFAALLVAGGKNDATAFGAAGANALVLLLLDMQHYRFLIARTVFGLWLVPLG